MDAAAPRHALPYVGEWVATKLRWGLAADQAEADALTVYAETCETTVVYYTPPRSGHQWLIRRTQMSMTRANDSALRH